MGGFQKFPIPRYLQSDEWVVNRRWRLHILNVLIPSALLAYQVMRNIEVSQRQYLSDKYYVDPESHEAPKKLVL
ncbi:hypothetical protein pb186bvf_010253 [Paramecium bursaria]